MIYLQLAVSFGVPLSQDQDIGVCIMCEIAHKMSQVLLTVDRDGEIISF